MKIQVDGFKFKMISKLKLAQANLFGGGMFNIEDKFSKININHIPIMITDDNKILCIPSERELFHIGVTAMTGKGKGIVGNSLLGLEYWMMKRHCMILNDFQQETFEQSLPCRTKEFLQNQKIVNLHATGLPVVYVYPSNKNLIIDDVEELFPHIKMSIPTRAMIMGIENYYKLDKSAKYFTANIDRFLECRDLQEIDEALNEIMEEENSGSSKKKSMESMKYKIRTVFKNIFDEMITDNASPDAPAFLTVRTNKGDSYNNLVSQSLIYANLVPSIQTSEIRSKSWFSAYMSFIVESIYEDKYKDSFMKNITLSMYVPEIDKMWKGENGALIKKSLELIGTNGRRAGIGLRWDAQDYDAVPDAIRANTKYLFVLRKANSKEVSGIIKDFNVEKGDWEKILSLETNPDKGVFECMALTTNRFILYNLRDGKTEYTSSAQKGKIIPPMAHHKRPGVLLGDLIKQ